MAKKQKAGGYLFCSTYLIHVMCLIYRSVEGYQCTKRSISQVFQLKYIVTCDRAVLSSFPSKFLLTDLLDILADFFQKMNDLRDFCLNYPWFDATVDNFYHFHDIRSIPPLLPGVASPVCSCKSPKALEGSTLTLSS